MTIVLALVALIAGFGIGYLVGRARRASSTLPVAEAPGEPEAKSPQPTSAPPLPTTPAPATDELAAARTERDRLADELAASRGETARYRQLVIDLENNAPPPFFGAGAPDDLKLIVGIGPVLERMLHQLGVTTFRQIARWSERDIDEFDAKLPEFPGRIRRDAWVTQARELHQSKFGEVLPQRGL